MLVIPNWVDTNLANTHVAQAISLFDGIFAENGFATWSPVPNTSSATTPPPMTTAEEFEAQVGYVRHLQRNGKAYFSFNGWGVRTTPATPGAFPFISSLRVSIPSLPRGGLLSESAQSHD